MRYVLLVCVTCIVLSGCAAIQDYHYCFVNHRRAANAWKDLNSRADRHEYSSDYETGWKAGYFDISTGGCGEPPVIPPPKYWSTRYQCVEGQAAIQDWFAGFQDGATAAESEGSGAFHYITTGPSVPTPNEGWANGVVEGAVMMPIDEGPRFLDETHQQLPALDPFHALPPPPESRPEAISPTPAPMPVPQGQSVIRPTEARQRVLAPPAELNSVPPVVTEE